MIWTFIEQTEFINVWGKYFIHTHKIQIHNTHTHNEHAEKHELKGIFDKKNQGDSTFYDQTVIHTQAVYVQKAQFYEVC